MRALRAPDGCSQYHASDMGAFASFNFDKESAIAANQDYSICFKSTPDICGLKLTKQTFSLPELEGKRKKLFYSLNFIPSNFSCYSGVM